MWEIITFTLWQQQRKRRYTEWKVRLQYVDFFELCLSNHYFHNIDSLNVSSNFFQSHWPLCCLFLKMSFHTLEIFVTFHFTYLLSFSIPATTLSFKYLVFYIIKNCDRICYTIYMVIYLSCTIFNDCQFCGIGDGGGTWGSK